MKKLFASIVLAASITGAVPAFAQATPISRRDGFLRVWQTINRPVGDIHTKAFTDVKDGDKGYAEITYAKSRGILSDGTAFRPDEPLVYQDALLMLFRTRNVDDLDTLTVDALPDLLKKYPIFGKGDQTFGDSVTAGALEKLIVDLDQALKTEVHEASLYSEKFQGKGTAFGEKFDMNQLTAAHRTFPYNTLVKVTNVGNGKSVTVRINDRGPYVKGRDMDLSLAAFTTIAERAEGKINVTFERLGDQSLVTPPTAPATVSAATPVATACPLPSGAPQDILPGITDGTLPRVMRVGQSATVTATQDFTVDGKERVGKNTDTLHVDVPAGQTFTFQPSSPGSYIYTFRSTGVTKAIRITVRTCGK